MFSLTMVIFVGCFFSSEGSLSGNPTQVITVMKNPGRGKAC